MKYIVFDCDGTLIDSGQSSCPLYPGILALLLELKSQGHQLYVWTARDRQSTLRILSNNQVLQLFESVYTFDEGPIKPDPSGLEKMLRGIAKDSICMIGDTFNDILGAQNFGVMSIAALWNNVSLFQELQSFSPDFIVYDPKECSKVITVNLKGDKDV